MRTAKLLAALALCTSTQLSSAAVIGFDDLAGANNDPFYVYSEDGFLVYPGGGADWVQNIVYGKPAPSLIFNRQRDDPELFAGVFISEENAHPFTFSAVDLYSSVTPIPYRFLGYREAVPVFDVYGTMPNTFGQFVTAFNTDFEIEIDLLYIELVNPYIAIGGNPVGFDNVVVTTVQSVPEPGALALALLPLALLAGTRFKRDRTELPQ